jgi:hypothetical protein
MSNDGQHVGGGMSNTVGTMEFLEPLRAALADNDEPARYRLLAAVLSELADWAQSENGTGGNAAQVEALSKKVQSIGEEKANLADELATVRADYALVQKQLEAEQARYAEIQKVKEEQRSRLEALKKEHQEVEGQLVTRNSQIHKLEVANEELTLKLQRAESAIGDTGQIDAMEAARRDLSRNLEGAQADLDQLRADKDAEIEKLLDKLKKAESGESQGVNQFVGQLWQRLAKAKPSLAEGHIQPDLQAAERLVDAFIELVRFVNDFDQSIRVFLGKYTKHNPSVKVPWDVYAKRDDVIKTAVQTVAPKGGRPVGLLKMRLRVLYSWVEAAMIGCDSAIECIASELQNQLMGPDGAGSNPNMKVRDFVKDDGHYKFLDHIRELRSQKLAEAFGRGS